MLTGATLSAVAVLSLSVIVARARVPDPPSYLSVPRLNAVLTAESASEQAAAGLTQLSQEEIKKFRTWNQTYREKFGFPFIICARLNKKDAILAAFPQRLDQDRRTEIATALEEIAKIAKLRLEDAIS